MAKYMLALKGWKGYKKSELLDGKYRPVFGKIETYNSKKCSAGLESFVRVPATRENIRKQLIFNIRYGSEGFQRDALRSAKARGISIKKIT